MSPRLLSFAVFAAALIAADAIAADAHEAAHGPGWFLLGLQVLNVAVLGAARVPEPVPVIIAKSRPSTGDLPTQSDDAVAVAHPVKK